MCFGNQKMLSEVVTRYLPARGLVLAAENGEAAGGLSGGCEDRQLSVIVLKQSLSDRFYLKQKDVQEILFR